MNLSKQKSQVRGRLNHRSRSETHTWPAGGGPKGLPPAAQHAALVGCKVLAGLAKGRQVAISKAQEKGAFNLAEVLILASQDIELGHLPRGRAGRISRRLHGRLTERSVKRILDKLSSESDLEVYDGGRTLHRRTPI